MSTISLEQVKHAAALVKIRLTNQQAVAMQTELDAILGYVRQLDALDTTGVEPTYQVSGLVNQMRSDTLTEDTAATPAELLKNAPFTRDGYIQVPKVL